MPQLLGIDTGGTYTDAVVIDGHQQILATAKSETTKHDLTIGIRNVIQSVLPHATEKIQLVSLSTTLATNAIVEGHGNPVCLILIGYDPKFVKGSSFERIRSKNTIIHVRGGHDLYGNEQEPLDLDSIKQIALENKTKISAFAISAYFGVMNPSHELKAKQVVRNLTGLPVTCGHELTSDLNAPVRAITTALNGRLISLMQYLIVSVQKVMADSNIQAPLMIVKGDGSLINAQLALERPIETIMSGPAASVIGAKFLTDCTEAFVVDMGGTTTDIAVLENGFPVVNESGSMVDGFRAMIKAVDTCTEGLGGDSEITLDVNSDIIVGPRRVIPLCSITKDYPQVLEELKKQHHLNQSPTNSFLGRFLLKQNHALVNLSGIHDRHQEVLDHLDEGPVSLAKLVGKSSFPSLYLRCIDDLIGRGLIVFSAFTPTDAACALGICEGDAEAALLGASFIAKKIRIESKQFCEKVKHQVSKRIAEEILNSAFYNEGISTKPKSPLDNHLINRALSNSESGSFSVSFSMNHPIVAIGAPVETYLPQAAALLKSQYLIPEHADVANAIGAVTGGVMQKAKILIKSMEEGALFRVFFAEGIRDFEKYDLAVAFGKEIAEKESTKLALRAGAQEVEVNISVDETYLKTNPDYAEEDLFYETEIIGTAFGRPHISAGQIEIHKN